ncbi:claudin-18 [Chanodichthys erythropterus]|uniref:claudin-18 n=1 Tax=Chanodichthys erythropterus TaxID=933992 RepID=UPI00351E1EA7
MSANALQTTGFVSGAIGMVGVFAATLMDVWCTRNQQEHKLTSIYPYKGLWKDCDVSSSGFTECQPLYSHLNYSGLLQAIRALMVIAILVSVIAVFIGFFCLKCLKMRSMELSTRAKLMLSSGILFIIAGLCGITGASVYADQIVPSFMITPYNQQQGEKGGIQCGTGIGIGGNDSFASRYTFGPALYIAWVGGALLILGGILKCIAFKIMQTKTDTREGYIYNAPAQCRVEDEVCQVQRS